MVFTTTGPFTRIILIKTLVITEVKMADFRVVNNISGFHDDEYEDDCLAEW